MSEQQPQQQPPWSYGPPAPPAAPPPKSKTPLIVGLVVVVCVLAAVVIALVATSGGDSSSGPLGGAQTTAEEQTPIEEASQACGNAGRVDSEGRELVLEGDGVSSSAEAISDADCVTGHLGMPRGIQAQVDNTTAYSGTQTATWDDYTITWSYNGLSDSFFMSITQD